MADCISIERRGQMAELVVLLHDYRRNVLSLLDPFRPFDENAKRPSDRA